MKKYAYILLILLVLGGCNTDNAKILSGKYKIAEFTSKDSNFDIDSSVLHLSSDRSFVLTFHSKKKILGTWESNDDGDRTSIRFTFSNTIADGYVEGENFEYIVVYKPASFGYKRLKSLSYYRFAR